MANAPPPFHMQTRARAGVAVPSRQKVEIDLANEYDYIINNLIEKDPETFPEPQALIQHVRITLIWRPTQLVRMHILYSRMKSKVMRQVKH